MPWHGYVGVQNLNLDQDQKLALIQAIRELGPENHPQPCMMMQVVVLPDNERAIFEALFGDNALSVESLKTYLANIFSINPDNIGHDINVQSFSGEYRTPVITLSYNDTDYIRVALFGGKSGSTRQSKIEAWFYIISQAR